MARPVGDNNQGMPVAADRAEDVLHTLADLLSVRQQKVAGVGVAAKFVEPILVSPLVLRLTNACVTSAGWAPLCYSCWTVKTA